MRMSMLSTVATYDDLRKCAAVLTEGTAEEEFLAFVRYHEGCRQTWVDAVQEAQRLQRELDCALKNMADLESKLYHARRIIESELKARKEAENERDNMVKKMFAVTDIVNEHINDETRQKISMLNDHCRKRKSATNKRRDLNDINSTGSFLSDLSLTQSEDDILNVTSDRWKKHRPSMHENSGIQMGGKRSRLSVDGKRKSGNVSKHRSMEINGNDRIVAHTKVSVPQGDGPILAESIIEAVPQMQDDCDYPITKSKSPKPKRKSEARTPQFTPSAPPAEDMHQNLPRHLFARNIMRPHQFQNKTFIRSEPCTNCQKKIKFGVVGLRCRDCRISIHVDCRENLTVACVPQSAGTPTKSGVMGTIADYSPKVGPMVPALIVHCVNEIETRGLTEVGIYRVSGSERDVKALKEQFLRGKGIPYLANRDIHVLCGCIKDFLRSLKEPLIPTSLWKDFSNAVQNVNKAKLVSDLYTAIKKLPQANRDTLAFLLQHFQRVAESEEVMMPITNLAKVFGPTIVGYSSANPDQHAIYTETVIQYTVLENILNIPTDYWSQFLNVDYNKEPEANVTSGIYFASPSFRSARKERKYYATPPYSSSKNK